MITKAGAVAAKDVSYPSVMIVMDDDVCGQVEAEADADEHGGAQATPRTGRRHRWLGRHRYRTPDVIFLIWTENLSPGG
jgi:hypothetical protein